MGLRGPLALLSYHYFFCYAGVGGWGGYGEEVNAAGQFGALEGVLGCLTGLVCGYGLAFHVVERQGGVLR